MFYNTHKENEVLKSLMITCITNGMQVYLHHADLIHSNYTSTVAFYLGFISYSFFLQYAPVLYCLQLSISYHLSLGLPVTSFLLKQQVFAECNLNECIFLVFYISFIQSKNWNLITRSQKKINVKEFKLEGFKWLSNIQWVYLLNSKFFVRIRST